MKRLMIQTISVTGSYILLLCMSAVAYLANWSEGQSLYAATQMALDMVHMISA